MRKLLMALITAATLTGCGPAGDDGTKSRYSVDIKEGGASIDFLYRDMDGKPFRLSAEKGKVVLLYFWRMKCEECKAELRALDALRKKYGRKGLVVVAVGADSMHSGSLYDVNRFLEKEGFGFVKLRDEDGFVAEAYRVMAAPETYIIGRDGSIAHIHKGPVDWAGPEKTAVIERILSGGAR